MHHAFHRDHARTAPKFWTDTHGFKLLPVSQMEELSSQRLLSFLRRSHGRPGASNKAHALYLSPSLQSLHRG
jgi:hypothetical protein